jgi:hypothetical protein
MDVRVDDVRQEETLVRGERDVGLDVIDAGIDDYALA